MRLPSIVFVLSEAKRAAVRFPLALLASIVAGACAIAAIDDADSEALLLRVLMAAQLGMPLLIAFSLAAERRAGGRWSSGAWPVGQLAGVTLLVAYFFTLPTDIGNATITRHVQLNIGVHLLVAFIPYIGAAQPNGFWQYNMTLFLRFVSGAVFSATLFAGLSIATLALDQLFGLPVEENIYMRLWVLVVFVFNSWYFLGGIPRDFEALEARSDYPAIIKVFAQYILAPLVAVYLVILLAYLAKVVVTTEWPSGWIGLLVSSVATAGLFSLVLLHPLVEQAENRWIKTYAKLFNVFILPAVVMLLLAVFKRIDQYGITENRYFLTVLALWLAFVAVYGLFARTRSIKIIPVSLCLVAVVSSFGPWGAYGVSRSSQTHRLVALLEKNQLLVDGALVPAPNEVDFEDEKQISAGFNYLIDRHGHESVSNWFNDELAVQVADMTGGKHVYHVEVTRTIMAYMGLELVEKWARGDHPGRVYFHSMLEAAGEVVDVSGYDVAYPVRLSQGGVEDFELGGTSYRIRYAEENDGLAVQSSGEGEEVLRFEMAPMFEDLRQYDVQGGAQRAAPSRLMVASAASETLRGKLFFFEVHWEQVSGDVNVQYVDAVLLLSTTAQ